MGPAASMIPIVDVSSWFGSDEAAARRTATAWVEALREVGFVYVVGHDVPWPSVAAVFETARSFFSLPAETLDAIHYRHGRRFRGYVPLGDPYAPPCHKESFDCGRPVEHYHGPATELATCPNLWPDGRDDIVTTLESYRDRLCRFSRELFSMLAAGLGHDRDLLAPLLDRPLVTLRLLRYPRHDGELSVGPHTDYEALTILAQDDVGGLQIRPAGGSWIDVPPLPESFVVSVGEMAGSWTQGQLRATEHRVRAPRHAERYSVAFFCGPNYDAVVEPLADPADHGSVWSPVATGTYLEQRLLEEHA